MIVRTILNRFLISIPFIILAAMQGKIAYAFQQEDKLWSVLSLTGNYNQLLYSVEPQLRLVYRENIFQQFLINGGLGHRLDPNWQLWLGQTMSANDQDAVPGSLDEYRAWEQIIWKNNWSSISALSRTRLEERKSLFFPQWGYRLRERISFKKPITANISLLLANEIFINLNKVDWIITNKFDQNRAYIGLEQQMTKSCALTVGYMSQYLSTAVAQLNHVLVVNWIIDLETMP